MRSEFWPHSWNHCILDFRLRISDIKKLKQKPYIPSTKPLTRNTQLETRNAIKTHFSNIPAFHHSNWGGAPNLYLFSGYIPALWQR